MTTFGAATALNGKYPVSSRRKSCYKKDGLGQTKVELCLLIKKQSGSVSDPLIVMARTFCPA